MAGFRLPAGFTKGFLSDPLSKESLAVREIKGRSLFSSRDGGVNDCFTQNELGQMQESGSALEWPGTLGLTLSSAFPEPQLPDTQIRGTYIVHPNACSVRAEWEGLQGASHDCFSFFPFQFYFISIVADA